MTDKNYTPLEVKVKPDKSVHLDKTGVDTLGAILSTNTLTAAAEQLEISRNTLYDRIARYKLKVIIDEIPKQAMMTLKIGSVKAADTMVGELNNSKNKLAAAIDILDRVGVREIKAPQVAVQVNNINKIDSMQDEQLNEFIS